MDWGTFSPYIIDWRYSLFFTAREERLLST